MSTVSVTPTVTARARCRFCRKWCEPQRSTRRYCSDACRMAEALREVSKMIIGRLEKKQSTDGKQFLSGRLNQDVAKGALVLLEKDPDREGAYRLVQLAPAKLNLQASHEVF